MKQKSKILLRVIEEAGGISRLAAALGTTKQAVSAWHEIPLGRVFELERITKIPRAELRPDFFGNGAALRAMLRNVKT